MVETVDIVKELIEELTLEVDFKTITDNGDSTYTITTCDTSYMYPCFKFVLDGVTYTVTNTVGNEFAFNEEFTISGNVVPTSTSVTLPALNYYHGTVIATKEELKLEELSSDKFPMVYLLEVLSDDFDSDPTSSINRNSALRLFFLSETEGNDWNTNEHYEYAIKPMRNVVYNFINHLEVSRRIGSFDSWTATNHAKFGVYVSGVGHTRRIFDDKLSGVEVNITLPIKEAVWCSNC